MAYDKNNTTVSPSVAAGAPHITNAASSSIRASTWPYKRTADVSIPHNIALRPPDAPAGTDDPLISSIADLSSVMQQVQRSTRLISAPWLVMPPDAESFHKGGGITIPAVDGLFHIVVTITCPPGRNGVMNEIANVVVGGAWSDFSGDAIFQIVRNPGAGNNTGGFAERNYEDIEASYGLINAPVKIAGIRIFENDILQFVIKNVALPVSGEKVGALLGGWFYPRTWDDQFEARDASVAW
jgi:hypothetical protein